MARASGTSRGTLGENGSSGAKRRAAWRSSFALAMFALAPAALVFACSAEQPLTPRPGEGGTGGTGAGTSVGPCVDGQVRACSVTIGEHNGILTCLDGKQACVEGTWGACAEGTISSRAAPPKAKVRQTSARPDDGAGGVIVYSHTAGPCVNNPCDPSCQVFEEQPDAGLTPDASGSIYDWQTGDLGDFPGGLVNKGLKEPCAQASDCQYNMQCRSPVTGTCAHHKCAEGSGLAADCDPCVTKICDIDPSCCAQPYEGTCAHDPCKVGGKLKSSCDACVKEVCKAKASCCSGTWDQSCVDLIPSECGKTCDAALGGWDPTCVDKVYTVCGATCQDAGNCEHSKCYAGPPLNPACDPCVAKVCAVSPSCCSTTWDNLCVDKVATLCQESCPVKGDCVPWLPGETDPQCTGIDLSVGVPCNGVVPVCNHGKTEAPAGVRLVHFPANSQQYPKCAPDQTHPNMQECLTQEPIPPGQCISVDANACGIGNGNREIMINPPKKNAASPYFDECFCENNWSLSSGGNGCAPPECSVVTSKTVRQVNMFVQFDRSGSMTINDRWGKATGALKNFFKDPSSAGLGVALRFWEHFKPVAGCDDTACNVDACSVPLVPLAKLTSDPAPTDAQEQKLVAAIDATLPTADTPLQPALAGAEKWAKAYQLANPAQQTVVVLVTDGKPNSCGNDNATIAAFAEDALVNAGVLTYAIGIQDSSPTLMNLIAQKGGTGSAFFISDADDIAQKFLSAMLQIKGDTVSCEFDLPNAGLFDPTNATVVYTPTQGQQVNMAKVLDAASCGNGWYFDNAANPSKITLCPTTCQTVLNDAGAQIDVQLGCPGSYDPATYTHVYQATCPTGTKVQWGWFAYDTVTPGDSNVIFAARTATAADQLSGAFTTLATARATPADTQLCTMAGPAPCPIDVYTKLDLPGARQEFLEFSVTFNPTTNKGAAPTLNGWEITYSCVDSE
ncbi:vWA domain-containing protein [Polyangium spumosum]|uniref:VWA domain-containing protein n=1 Tax=Polyangium spumosum TaxID=889282 RepID=A0A6N7PPM9_9BACT|nr:VWA domain-containing protein [Polyangium spumosum]MRG93943.1 VWA domain-containing protein [Polyangium spumosum]